MACLGRIANTSTNSPYFCWEPMFRGQHCPGNHEQVSRQHTLSSRTWPGQLGLLRKRVKLSKIVGCCATFVQHCFLGSVVIFLNLSGAKVLRTFCGRNRAPRNWLAHRRTQGRARIATNPRNNLCVQSVHPVKRLTPPKSAPIPHPH